MAYIFIDSYIYRDDGTIEIDDESAHYVSNVLRQKAGDSITLFNNIGQYWGGDIVSIRKNQVIINAKPLPTPDVESLLDITLYQGLLKGEKMDLVVQKATELGVKKIVPIITQRCIPTFTRKIERLKKIATQASRQCGRVIIPEIIEPLNFKESLSGKGIIFYEQSGSKIPVFDHSINEISLYIGPEGGFSVDEIRVAEEHGLTVASLGKRILRAETAAITAVVLMQYLYGDLSFC
ncbi:MAG: 16S rRNA (uracil(1498)-N(3))-methyltransferase [Nitrospirae bacterium]|nr:16S rRNA (uracil(1498)-N(3))-methyltransferase [Nitrospirota bacterium]MBF0541553.1 16S rRNA (uracil(1498)-N(3))-methyltransferase [Nitrospirota bacterium]